MDTFSPEQRSRCMSRISAKDTKPELVLRMALWKVGLRYRVKHQVPGHPDIIFPNKKVALFVDGCFWHGCPEHYQAPEQNADFWSKKIARNTERDRQVNEQLKTMGWHVVRFWEHEIQKETNACVQTVIEALQTQHD